MPITRLYNYLPGSLAEGDKVQAEYDSIIAFINGLELDKLDVTGGTVSNLTVSGVFTTNGVNTFNGASTFNSNVSLASGADLSLGAGSDLAVLGATTLADLTVTGATHLNGNATDVNNSFVVKGNNAGASKLEIKHLNSQVLFSVTKPVAYSGFGSVSVEDSQSSTAQSARIRPQGLFVQNTSPNKFFSMGFWSASAVTLGVTGLPDGFFAKDTSGANNQVTLDASTLTMQPTTGLASVFTLDKKTAKFTSTTDTRKAWYGDIQGLTPLGTEWGLALEAGAGSTSKIEIGMIITAPKITIEQTGNQLKQTAFGVEFDSSGTGDWSIIGGIVAGSTVAYFPHLPTVAGASGTLWVDVGAGNVVKRVP